MEWNAEDDEFAGPPLPREDRLWIHPSELRAAAAEAAAPPAAATSVWPIAAASFVLGALVVGGAWFGFSQGRPATVEVTQQVAVTPVMAVPQPASAVEWASAVHANASPTLVRVEAWPDGKRAEASGVIIRDDGLVLTAAQVVGDVARASVTLSNGLTVDGEVIGVDWIAGIALLDLEDDGYDTAVLSTEPLTDDQAVVLLGFDTAALPSRITEPETSAFDREQAIALHGIGRLATPLAPDWSGGAVLADTGAVIGVLSVLGAGDSVVVPLGTVDAAIDQLERSGVARHASLSVQATDGPTSESGAELVSVDPTGPADVAGLEPGDVVRAIDGVSVDSTAEMVVAVRSHEPGHAVRVSYERDGESMEATVVLDGTSRGS